MRPIAEVIWLLEWIKKAIKVAPKKNWRWAPYSSSWDPTEIRDTFRNDATEDAEVIWLALKEYSLTNRWPKLTARASHFLRERLWAAQFTCEDFLETHNPNNVSYSPIMPADSETLIRRLVIEDWNQSGVEAWLDEEESSFQEKEEW